ncbi:MAG TPA: CAP domain-containing protein [Pyrinomonadaceae bacterium]|nr:CAP domain-containing protein [Pyrinomonadaceae bacterium]
MYRRSSPRRASVSRALQALFIALIAGSTGFSASANGGTKPTSKPVARLISTSRDVAPARPERVRQVARVAPSGGARYVRASSPSAVAAASNDERRAFDLINAERRAKGRQPLTWDGSLTRVARYHSENMARQGFFNHIDRNGSDIRERAYAHGVGGWRALGENIAYNQGYDDPAGFAVERWMTSSKHRENILNGEFTHAGLGVARTADGRVFFTQVFMKR